MNDDKKRDWISKRLGQLGIDVRQSKHGEEMRQYLSLLHDELDMTEKFILEDGGFIPRSHIPPQPPIAEDVRELAELICRRFNLNRNTDLIEIEKCFIEPFLTAHTAEQDKETIRTLAYLETVIGTIQDDFKTNNMSTGNYSDGEVTQDYTTRLELIERGLEAIQALSTHL